MGHSHSHHGHDHPHSQSRSLGLAFAVTALLLLIKVAGGVLTGSMALLSDAAHSLTDVLALAFSYWAVKMAGKPPTPSRTYGYHRVGILTALGNSLLLILLSAALLYESFTLLLHPLPVRAPLMLAVSLVSLLINGLLAGQLAHGTSDLNVKSAWLHIVGDAASSLGVLLAAGLILWTGQTFWDPLAGILISLVILRSTYQIVRETLDILMEGTPPDLDLEALVHSMEDVPGVEGVHHVHVWSLAPGRIALSGHLILADCPIREGERIVDQVDRVLASRFHIAHSTLQVETTERDRCQGEGCHPLQNG